MKTIARLRSIWTVVTGADTIRTKLNALPAPRTP